MENVPLLTKEKLAEIQAVLDTPELKVQKSSDTRWLARERCVQAVRKSLLSLVITFQYIYNENGDAEACGLTRLLCTYKFVACYSCSAMCFIHLPNYSAAFKPKSELSISIRHGGKYKNKTSRTQGSANKQHLV